MSYEERGQWVYLTAIVVTLGGYLAAIAGQAANRPLIDIDYVPLMLWAIGIAIALSIAGRIVVEIAGRIADPTVSQTEDVRDRDIGRAGESIAGAVLGVAMVVPFVLTVKEVDHFWIGNAIYLAFALSAVVGSIAKLVAYRRGL